MLPLFIRTHAISIHRPGPFTYKIGVSLLKTNLTVQKSPCPPHTIPFPGYSHFNNLVCYLPDLFPVFSSNCPGSAPMGTRVQNSLSLLIVCVRVQSWIVSLTDFNILPIDQLFCFYGIRNNAAVSSVACIFLVARV